MSCVHRKAVVKSPAKACGAFLQVINYDTDLPAHYTLSATFNFHDVKLNDQEQAAIRIIWNECVPAWSLGSSTNTCAAWGPLACACAHAAYSNGSTGASGSLFLLQGVPWPHIGG
jgi:hypothetical protein